jgi:hypothetical protein
MRTGICCHSTFRLTTSSLLRLTFNPLILLKRRLDSLFRSQLTWLLRSRLGHRRQLLSTKPCVYNKKQMACCNALKFRLRFKMRKSTRTSGNLRPRMREFALQVLPLRMPERRQRPISSRPRLKLMKLNSWLTLKELRRMPTSNLLNSNTKMK